MQAQSKEPMVNVAETEQGLEVHLIEDLDMLHAILTNCDSWTQLDNTFLCIRGNMVGVFAWIGELEPAT